MSFCRQTSRTYCDVDDLEGALNILGRSIMESDDEQARTFMKGAYYTVLILRHHSWVDSQADYMAVLSKYFHDEYDRDMTEGDR